MSATAQDVSAQTGDQPNWQQLQGPLNTEPYLQLDQSAVDPATAQDLLSSQPQPGTESMGPPPLSPDQESSITQDMLQQRERQKKQAEENQGRLKQYESDVRSDESVNRQLDQAEIASMAAEPPPAPSPQPNPLGRLAPLLLLAAFGGKLTKLDANAMLGATIGTVRGFLDGNQQQYENSIKQYDQAYQRFQDRQAQQQKIYETMRQSYAGRADADLKALEMSRKLTEDDGGAAIDQQLLQIQEHYNNAAQRLAQHNDDLKQRRWYEGAQIKLRADKQKKADQATVQGAGAPGSPEWQNQVKMIANYQIPMPSLSAWSMRDPNTRSWYQRLLTDVKGANPQFNQQLYTVSQRERIAFTQGRQGDQTRAFNVVVQHLDVLGQLNDKMNNSDWRGFNALKNSIAGHFGDPDVTNLKAASQFIAGEVVKAVTGAQGALADRESASSNISTAAANNQLKGQIDTYKLLAGGQLYGLQQQYRAGTQTDDFAQAMFLSPEAKTLLQRAQAVAEAGTQSSGWGTATKVSP